MTKMNLDAFAADELETEELTEVSGGGLLVPLLPWISAEVSKGVDSLVDFNIGFNLTVIQIEGDGNLVVPHGDAWINR